MKPVYETQLLQNYAEHDAFLELLKAEGARSYLEIGLGYGGSFWRVGNALPVGSRVVGVTLSPTSDGTENLTQCVNRLKERGYEASFIAGNSRDQKTVAAASDLAPFDCVFIDGDHSYHGAKADWLNYGPLGRMVAFHDISWNETWVSKVPGRVTKPMGVPTLWREIKSGYRHQEIRLYRKGNYYGIGVLWRD